MSDYVVLFAFGIQALLVSVVVAVWLFFFIHAIQYIDDPFQRTEWALLFLFFNVLCVPLYVRRKYLAFRRIGKGGLIREKAGTGRMRGVGKDHKNPTGKE